MAQEIKIFNDPDLNDFVQETVLDGQRVSITLSWNLVSGFWFIRDFTLLEAGQFLSGIKVRPSFLLLDPYKRLLHGFVGDLYVSPLEENEKVITKENLGVTFKLLYLDEDEVRIWKSINGLP